MITDRVGDFIIRLQNAAHAGKRDVTLPYSTHLFAIAKKLEELGFVSSAIREEGKANKKNIQVVLAVDEQGVARVRGVKRISKPGRRLYVSHTAAHKVKGGTGARIISSPAGIVSDQEARKIRVGGEELFEIW